MEAWGSAAVLWIARSCYVCLGTGGLAPVLFSNFGRSGSQGKDDPVTRPHSARAVALPSLSSLLLGAS